MNIKIEKATANDIDALVEMRLEYLLEDYGSLTDDQLTKIKSSLPDYYQKHLGRDLPVYVTRARKKFHKNSAILESLLFFISAGVPFAITDPPSLSAPGPSSISQLQFDRIFTSCSMTITECPCCNSF